MEEKERLELALKTGADHIIEADGEMDTAQSPIRAVIKSGEWLFGYKPTYQPPFSLERISTCLGDFFRTPEKCNSADDTSIG